MEYRKTAFKIVHKPLLWQKSILNHNLFVEETSIWMETPLIAIRVTACARKINITYHSTVDGVPEISVQVCEQAVANPTKHVKS